MKALVVQSPGQAAVVDVEDPPVRDEYVKIKVHAVALNPTDWKHIDNIAKGGEIVGCDVAGTVEAVGSQVKAAVKVGDRIAGLTHGSNQTSPRDGGFAERAEVKDGVFLKLPDSWSFADGATLGVGITTVGQGLYQSLKLPPPEKPATSSFPVLIYGGSTATGTLAIQYAHLSGLKVITLASPRHFDTLKKLGASACYDYNQEGVGNQIRSDTDDKLFYAFDCITEEGSMAICAQALASGPKDGQSPQYSGLLPPKDFPRDDCNARSTLGYTAVGETFTKRDRTVEAKPEDLAFARQFWASAQQLVSEGKIKPHPAEERSGGLEGILSGLKDLKEGKVRGVKVVYGL